MKNDYQNTTGRDRNAALPKLPQGEASKYMTSTDIFKFLFFE